jgi:CRP/FNR family cyclic AMP-dependent transcriptional regulator
MRKALHLLGIMDDIDIDWLATVGTQRRIKIGELLIEEKKPIDSIYIVLDGKLSVVVGGTNGKHIATLLQGEVVGEMSFVDSHLPSASVVAEENSLLLSIDRKELTTKLARDQAFAARFYHAIANFLADRLYVTVGRLGYGSAQQDVDGGELQDAAMDNIDLAAVRFDKLLRRLRGDLQGTDASR